MKTAIHFGRFKRLEATFNGHEDSAGREVYFNGETVRIIGPRVGQEDDDLYIIEAHGKRHTVDGCDLSPHPESEETNVEFIERVMESASPLNQAFVLQAVEEFAKAVLAEPVPAEDNGMISQAAWRDCATFVLGQFAARDLIRQNGRKEVIA